MDCTGRYNLFISPSEYGHYSNYYRLLKEDSPLPTKMHVYRSLYALLKIVLIKQRKLAIPENIVFLFGERFYLTAIILRLFGFKTSLFFYYVQNNPTNKLRKNLIVLLLKFLKYLEIKTVSIENPTKLPSDLFSAVIFDVVSGNISKLQREDDVIRVMGYIDKRKNLKNIIIALSILCKDRNKLTLEIIGKVDKNYLQELSVLIGNAQNSNLKILLLNDSINNKIFIEKLSSAGLVIAYNENYYGSSGIVLESINQKTPVIFCANGPLTCLSKYFNYDPNTDLKRLITLALTKRQYFIFQNRDLAGFRSTRNQRVFSYSFWSILYE